MRDYSMEPNILESAALLADMESTKVREGGIFTVSLGKDLPWG